MKNFNTVIPYDSSKQWTINNRESDHHGGEATTEGEDRGYFTSQILALDTDILKNILYPDFSPTRQEAKYIDTSVVEVVVHELKLVLKRDLYCL